jgi:hypothetical protein
MHPAIAVDKVNPDSRRQGACYAHVLHTLSVSTSQLWTVKPQERLAQPTTHEPQCDRINHTQTKSVGHSQGLFSLLK